MHVREHLADPGLRVEELARRHHLSVRQAYTLFERIGTMPGAYLREQRLLAAQAMLSDPRCAHLGISGIAAAVGILHLRTFERVFRRQYGMTPRSLRWSSLSRKRRPTDVRRVNCGARPDHLTHHRLQLPPQRIRQPTHSSSHTRRDRLAVAKLDRGRLQHAGHLEADRPGTDPRPAVDKLADCVERPRFRGLPIAPRPDPVVYLLSAPMQPPVLLAEAGHRLVDGLAEAVVL